MTEDLPKDFREELKAAVFERVKKITWVVPLTGKTRHFTDDQATALAEGLLPLLYLLIHTNVKDAIFATKMENKKLRELLEGLWHSTKKRARD